MRIYKKRLLYRNVFAEIKKIVSITDRNTFQIIKNILLFNANSDKYNISEQEIQLLLQSAKELFGDESAEVYLIYEILGKKIYIFDCNYDKALYYYKRVADYFVEHPLYENREAHMCIRSCADLFCNLYRKTMNEEFKRLSEEYLTKADDYGNTNIVNSLDERFCTNITYQVHYSDNIRAKLCSIDGDYETAHFYLDNCEGIINEFELREGRSIALDRASLYRDRANLYIQEGKPTEALKAINVTSQIFSEHFNNDSIKFDSIYSLQCQCYSMVGEKKNLQSILDKLTRLAQKYYHESHAIYATINKYTEILKSM